VPFFAPADTSVESRAFLTRATTYETPRPGCLPHGPPSGDGRRRRR
jgi:hypothetical protein